METLITLMKKYAPPYVVVIAIGFIINNFKDDLLKKDLGYYIIIGYIIIAFSIAIIIYIVDNKKSKSKKQTAKKKVFYYTPRKGDTYDFAFYEHLAKNIESCKSQLIMTGDGFGCDNEESIRKAHEYINSYRKILNNNIHIVRVQLESRSHPKWADLIGSLLEDFPDYFKLFIVKDDFDGVSDTPLLAIDPEIQGHNSVAILYTSEKYFGLKPQSLSTFAFIVEDDIDFSKEIAKRVRLYTNPKYSKKINNLEETRRHLCPDNKLNKKTK